MGAPAAEVVEWLDAFLEIAEIEDYPGALNGLQVEPPATIARVGAATDACMATIEAAVAAECDLLLAHHGLFWGDPVPLTGPAYRRVKALIDGDMGVYAAHLPLDAHPEIGNNVLLAEALGLTSWERFGTIRGARGLGVVGGLDLGREALASRVAELLGRTPRVIEGGPPRVRRLAIVSGGAGSMLAQAAAAGADTFVTGEGGHHTYHEALELGMNLVYAGHYATETLGVRALAEKLAATFELEQRFFDHPTGL